MNVRRDRGSSLILASLRGFCLFIFFMDTLSDYLPAPAGRQVGKIYPPLGEKPHGTSVPPCSGVVRLKFMNNEGQVGWLVAFCPENQII
jgi:hypothetical protein